MRSECYEPEKKKNIKKRKEGRYKYAIYFTWDDGMEDSFNVYDAEERDININDMLMRGDFKSIEWCRIYANGEYGIHTKVV